MNGSKERITEREYWAAKKGQLALDKENAAREAAGYGFHHQSDDGKYLIMGNGTRAFAVAAEQAQRDNPLKTAEQTTEHKRK